MLKINTFFKSFAAILIISNLYSCTQEAKDVTQTRNELTPLNYTKDLWYLPAVKVPQNLTPYDKNNSLLIAIVDDGVRTSHQDLAAFIWNNPKEIPRNNIDDDGNGYVDDVNGWNVSDDNNNNISPPEDRLQEYYHGTHLAGIITNILNTTYGSKAPVNFKILPIKALSDQASTSYIKYGYQGIEYALQNEADIILAAWGVEHISPEETAILNKANQQGVLIVSTAGNFLTGKLQYPAATEGVLAISGLGQNGNKIPNSNYGMFVDLLAPGENISSASVMSDDAYEIREGTSQAAAIVTAAAAIVKQQHPEYSAQQIIACLKHSADPVTPDHPRLQAGLGAGKLNIGKAIKCDLFTQDSIKPPITFNKPQGYLYHNARFEKSQSWKISPSGEFKGLRFYSKTIKGASKGSTLEFYVGQGDNRKLLESFPLDTLPSEIYVPGMNAEVILKRNSYFRNIEILLEYREEPIDYSQRYCKGIQELNQAGTIQDGSGKENYAFDTNCKWLITAPLGKRIEFKFSELDTQRNVDKIYFFNGRGTHEDVMATFSGKELPPVFKTWGNEVLVWFVSDGDTQGSGWKTNFEFVDANKPD